MTDVVTSRRRETTRQRLLDAAAEVFAEVGLDAASVEAICERAGYTRGAFYSNFETKDELFFELARVVARERIDSVHGRVRQLEHEGAFDAEPGDMLAVVQQVLDFPDDERVGVLLMSEIRIRALRDPRLAAAYVAHDAELIGSVAQIVRDLGQSRTVRFRVPADEVARLMVTVWESVSVRSVIAGVDAAEARRRTTAELARVAQLIIEPR